MTESTKAAVSRLIREQRYTSCGIGVLKQSVFPRGGGPALYVRGDEWKLVEALPQPVRSRVVRYWPGAAPENGALLPSHLLGRSAAIDAIERPPGLLDACMLVSEDGSDAVTITLWETHAAMVASRVRATRLRTEAARLVGAEVRSTVEYRVDVHGVGTGALLG